MAKKKRGSQVQVNEETQNPAATEVEVGPAAEENSEVVKGLASKAAQSWAALLSADPIPDQAMAGIRSEAEAEAETETETEDNDLGQGEELLEGDILATLGEEGEGFLAAVTSEADLSEEIEVEVAAPDLEGSELADFESAEIEDVEFIEEERLDSIIESILFASDRPVSLNQIKMVFKGTQIKTDKLRRAMDRLAVELAGSRRGVTLEEVPGGFQLRTKVDNMEFLTRTLKARPFKLSGPALETLAIVAYKQPLIKAELDEIRGVESGHLLRALMEKGLVNFEGKSDLPGKPMQYATTRKFLEIFGLRNLKELPTLSQIDELLPEGIDEIEAEKPTLSQITDNMSTQAGFSYSEGEEELTKITEQLQVIDTTSDFFEQEKLRERERRDAKKADEIREALLVGEQISNRDRNWLTRYDEALAAGQTQAFAQGEIQAEAPATAVAPASALSAASEAFDQDLDLESASFDSEPTSDDEELAVPYHDDEDEDLETKV